MREDRFSLLFPDGSPSYRSTPPVFFEDLQLEGIFRAIVSKYMEFDIRKYFYTIPDSLDIVRYRQDIYRDLEQNENMLSGLKKYTNRLLTCEKCFRFYQQAEDELKKGSYLLLTCQNYFEALELLRNTLNEAELVSEGLLTCRRLLEEKFGDTAFEQLRHTVHASFSEMEQLQLTLLIREKEISVVEDEEDPADDKSIAVELKQFIRAFDVETEEAWEREPGYVTNLFPAPLETSPLENRIVEILKKSRPSVFVMLKEFASVSFSLEGDCFVRLKNEVTFFLSFYEFEDQLRAAGYQLHAPKTEKDGSVEIMGAYDLALAWKNRFSGNPVVPNDI